MHVTFFCPRCEQSCRSEPLTATSELSCAACGWTRKIDPAALGDVSPKECLRCGNPDLWRQKNFPQWLGLSFVALGAVTSSIAWAYHRPVWALGILLGFAALDMILYWVMPDVLVCYRCRTKHHRADVSAHAGFNHELAERYRQERIRLERSGGKDSRPGTQQDMPSSADPGPLARG